MIFLRDHKVGEQKGMSRWEEKLSAVFSLTHENAVAPDALTIPDEPTELCCEEAIIFLHATTITKNKWIQWFSQSGPHAPKGRLVIISTVGQETTQAAWPERISACYWTPDQFSRKSEIESVREFIVELEKGVFRPELLQPCAVPETMLAYALAVHYNLQIGDIKPLGRAADRAYKEMLPFARIAAGRKLEEREKGVENLLPDAETFGPISSSANEVTSQRFRSMRRLIDILRADG